MIYFQCGLNYLITGLYLHGGQDYEKLSSLNAGMLIHTQGTYTERVYEVRMRCASVSFKWYDVIRFFRMSSN